VWLHREILKAVTVDIFKDQDAAKAAGVMQTMFTTKKLDITRLQQAYDQQ
jgi:hypothetical protein